MILSVSPAFLMRTTPAKPWSKSHKYTEHTPLSKYLEEGGRGGEGRERRIERKRGGEGERERERKKVSERENIVITLSRHIHIQRR